MSCYRIGGKRRSRYYETSRTSWYMTWILSAASRNCNHSVKLLMIKGIAGDGFIPVASTRLTMLNCNNRSTPCLSGIATQHLPSSTCRMFHHHRSLAHSQVALGTHEDGQSKNFSPQNLFYFIRRIGPYISTITLPTTRIPLQLCRRWEMRWA
jgi:hypothetical protein